MGLTIILQGENGNEYESIIDDELIQTFLPDYHDKSSYCLRFIDLYGDTTFNNLQMDELITELKEVHRKVESEDKKTLITEIIRLANKCKSEAHLYLKFYGD